MMCCGKEEGEISRGEETREIEGGMRIVKRGGGGCARRRGEVSDWPQVSPSDLYLL